ncbi:glycosyltransferase, partial [Azospirillum formosense]|nr:glycosyltransferase [Azospirillum formosense]
VGPLSPRTAGWRSPAPMGDVVVPVYRGREETLACLRSVFAAEDRTPREIIVIDDASPDADLVRDLAALAAEGRITLLRNARNLGFPATVNRGLALHPDRDAVLLNADTLVAGPWLERLRAAAWSAPDIGTVTPLSNDATILSYPSGTDRPPPPSLSETAAFDRLARAVNAGLRVDLPTAVGFCAYIRRDCLEETGPFEERLFGRGYGEENDFCLRARRLGWRHLGAADVFVAHVGGRSFGRQKAILAARNSRLLERLHPGYDALVQDFIAADPLMAARRRLDLARWAEESATGRAGAILLVTLAGRGGVARFIEERTETLRAEGWRVLRLVPEAARDDDDEEDDDNEDEEGVSRLTVPSSSLPPPSIPPERRCRIEVVDRPDLRDLVFRTAAEFDELVEALRLGGTAAVEIHHLLDHDAAVLDLAGRLGVPYDLTVHDYGLICPRLNLVDKDGRYCGEPDLAGCERCTADPDDRADPDLTVGALRRRTRALLPGARRVRAPTRDVAAGPLRNTAPRPGQARPSADIPPSTPAAAPPRRGPPRRRGLGPNGVRR